MNPLVVALFVVIAIAYFWWLGNSLSAIKGSSKDNWASYREGLQLSRESLAIAKESNRLRSDETAALRELIAELRAVRQAPGPEPSQSANSN
jgi:hypothetical protein